MSTAQIEIQLIAVVVAAACALPGVFLVLRRMALLSDAISHAILLGIVIGFFLVRDLASPLLVVGAAVTGVLTVVLVELLHRTGRVREDAAIGLVFPVLFSIGVILIARHAGSVHLDVDAVLLGELAFAPFDRWVVAGQDLGPKSLYLMLGILLINLVFIVVFFKELKLATFDAALAAALGFSPVAIHYALMSLVSVTAVGAFNAVGSVLVVALMIAPPATAYLLTDRLGIMLLLSAGIGALAGVSGYWLAHLLDASIAGAMATMCGVLFGAAFLFAPQRGLVAAWQRRRRQRWDFALAMLTIHLYTHEESPEAVYECRREHLTEHIRWSEHFADRVVERALRGNLIQLQNGLLLLTDEGRSAARKAIVELPQMGPTETQEAAHPIAI
jgi:manganese/zinc/iron transport system permease protein